MVPERFALRVRKGASKQWQVVRRWLRDGRVTEVVNACDAGREGELIFRYAYDLAGAKAPVLRLWLSALTDNAVRRAWQDLRPGERYDALADAARCRSEADWLVGLNATRAMTCLGRKAGGDLLLSVGRVQTPTLAMIVARDRAIEAFVAEPFWQVRATFSVAEATWEATFFRPQEGDAPEREPKPGEEAPHAERLPDEAAARAVAKATEGRRGALEQAERKRQVERPPFLYDLTSLQRRANQRHGFPADKTLALAQVLYEKHKLITYPRTDARHLTTDQVAGLPDILRGLAGVPVYQPFADALLTGPIQPGKRVVNDAEVGDHHAIVPTGRTPRSAGLSVDEKRVFDLVARRFLAALSEDALFEKTLLIVAVDPGEAPLPDGVQAPLRYRARGRVCLREGWRAVDPPRSAREVLLPGVESGVEATAREVEVKEGRTRPPRPHTDATLLRAMETAGKDLDDDTLERAMRNAGLGTPATRAAILQTLLDRKFVVREKKTLRSTEQGRALIDAVPVDELKSAELTGRYEARLSAMAEGREARAAFMADVQRHVHEVVAAIAAADPPPAAQVRGEAGPVLGTCPLCETPVRETRAVFSCETGRDCAFVVFKTMSKRRISARMVKDLLQSGRTRPVKGFRSRKGKEFSAGLHLEASGKVGFWFEDRGPPRVTPVGEVCPRCGQGRLIVGRAAWGCDRWREGCDYVLPFVIDGQALDEAEAARRVAAERSRRGP